MKFGRQLSELVDPKFRNYCVAYNMLKSFIRETDGKAGRVIQTIQDVTSAAVPFLPPAPAEQLPSVLFQEALNAELDKLNQFSELEQETLLGELRSIIRKARVIDHESRDSLVAIEELKGALEKVSEEICAFWGFISLNYTAFRKITKKEAKVHRTSSASWFMANVARAPFMTIDFDRLLVACSIGYELLRSPQPQIESTPVARISSGSSSRLVSAWISPDDLWQVKVALARVMSLELVMQPGSRQGLLDTILGTTSSGSRQPGSIQTFQRVHAEYLDTPWFEFYKDQASGKTHRGFQVEIVGDAATISLPSGSTFTTTINVWEEVWGSGAESQGLLDRDALEEIKALKKEGVVQMVDCEYSRYVYYYEDTNHGFIEVRLEENSEFTPYTSNEKLEDKNSKFTGHALYISVPKSAPRELPEWLNEIVGMPGVTEVPNFTKRVHGLFVYADNKVGSGVPAPSWATQKIRPLQASPRVGRPVSLEEPVPMSVSPVPPKLQLITHPEATARPVRDRLTQAKREATSFVSWIFGGGKHRRSSPLIRDAIIKIEPKSFFACERNLLDWTHTCVVVSGLAALHGGLPGLVISLIPVLILAWESRLFRVRNAHMMEKEASGYADQFGPQLLFAALVCLAADMFVNAVYVLVVPVA